MIALSYIKESPTMRLTSRKKTILSYFEPDNREWVTGEIGAPPLDVSGVAYLLYGTGLEDNRHWLESTRRTLEAMVKRWVAGEVPEQGGAEYRYGRRDDRYRCPLRPAGYRFSGTRYGRCRRHDRRRICAGRLTTWIIWPLPLVGWCRHPPAVPFFSSERSRNPAT